jgi:Protein of unknown function (DUF664)
VQAQLSTGEEAALSGTHVIPEDAWEGQVRVSLRWVLVHMIEEQTPQLRGVKPGLMPSTCTS